MPVIVLELLLVVGAVVAFVWWQLRSIKHDQQKAARERDAEREKR